METQETIVQWAVATFGDDGSDLRCATRANEEMAELLSCLSRSEPDLAAVAEELADVCIVLARVGSRLQMRLLILPARHDAETGGAAANWYAFTANAELARAMNFLRLIPDGQRYATPCIAQAWTDLGRTATALGLDLQAAIDAKMAKNRQRVWRVDGSGHGYHVKEPAG